MKMMNEYEAAEYLGDISVNTLRVWRYHRTGPEYRKVGRLVRYSEADLNEYLDSVVVHTNMGGGTDA